MKIAKLGAVAAIAASALIAGSIPASAAGPFYSYTINKFSGKGHCIPTSKSQVLAQRGGSKLSWQRDGNLVRYTNGKATWATGTVGASSICFGYWGEVAIYRAGGRGVMWRTTTDSRGPLDANRKRFGFANLAGQPLVLQSKSPLGSRYCTYWALNPSLVHWHCEK